MYKIFIVVSTFYFQVILESLYFTLIIIRLFNNVDNVTRIAIAILKKGK